MSGGILKRFSALGRKWGGRIDLRKDRGFALLIVLVVLVTLSIILTTVIDGTRHYTDGTASRLSALRLGAAIDGAIATYAMAIASGHYAASDIPTIVKLDGIDVRLRIRSEASKVDINFSDGQVISRLLQASALSAVQADALAREIIEWRGSTRGKASAVVQPHSDIAHYRPPHELFNTIFDLALVPDGGDDLVECLEPDITIYSRSGDVDIGGASERVRQAVQREVLDESGTPDESSIVGGAAGRPDLYEISAFASDTATHKTMSRQLVVRVTGDKNTPIWILSQTGPVPSDEDAAAACSRLTQRGGR